MSERFMIGSGRCHGPGCRVGNAGARLAGLAARGVECGTSCPTCGAMLRATAGGELVPVGPVAGKPCEAVFALGQSAWVCGLQDGHLGNHLLANATYPQVAHSGWLGRLFNRWRRE